MTEPINRFTAIIDDLILGLPRLIAALLLLIITLWLARRLSGWASYSLKKIRGLPSSAVGLLTSILNAGVIGVGALAVLNVLGLGQLVVSTIASLGIAGLIIGFALQDITKQFASGVMLLLARPFEIGDTIKVGVHEGTVTELELRTTRLRTSGGDEVLIPNADVYSAALYNMSRYPQRRLAVPLQLPFSAALESLREDLLASVSAIPGVAPLPEPTVVCTSVIDGKVSAELRFWVDRATVDQDDVLTSVIVVANHVLTPKQRDGETASAKEHKH